MPLSSIPIKCLTEITSGLNTGTREACFCVESKIQAHKLNCVPSGDADFPWEYGSQTCNVPELVEGAARACTGCDRAGSQRWLWQHFTPELGYSCAFNPAAFPFNLCEIKPSVARVCAPSAGSSSAVSRHS